MKVPSSLRIVFPSGPGEGRRDNSLECEQEMKLESALPVADWKLEHIDYIGFRSDKRLEGVFVFQGTLVSRHACQIVNLEVTVGAFKNLYSELEDDKPKDTRIAFALVTDLLRAMIQQWLKPTGESKWNPVVRSIIRIPYFCTTSKACPEFYLEGE